MTDRGASRPEWLTRLWPLPGHCFCFAAKQDLDGRLPAELGVSGAIDNTDAAGAELLFDAVMAEGLTDHEEPLPGGSSREPARELQ